MSVSDSGHVFGTCWIYFIRALCAFSLPGILWSVRLISGADRHEHNKGTWQDWYMLPWLRLMRAFARKGANVANNPYTEPAVNYPQGVTFEDRRIMVSMDAKKIGHNIAIDGIAGAQTWEALTYEMRQAGIDRRCGRTGPASILKASRRRWTRQRSPYRRHRTRKKSK